MPGGVRCDVVDHVVVTGWTDARRNIVQVEGVTHLPGDDVVGARSVAAHADRADQFAVLIIEGKSTAEDVHTADFFTDQRIVVLAVILRRAFLGSVGIDRITVLETVERATRLNRGKKIGG